MAPSPDRPGDMPRMQQEALRRGQEMQAKARASGGEIIRRKPPASIGNNHPAVLRSLRRRRMIRLLLK